MKINEKICIAPNLFNRSAHSAGPGLSKCRFICLIWMIALSGPRARPKQPITAPRRNMAQDDPKTAPRHAKTAQDGAKTTPRRPQTIHNHSKTALQALPIIGGRSKIERKSNRYRTFAGQGPPGRGVEGKGNQENNENNQMTERALCEARV